MTAASLFNAILSRPAIPPPRYMFREMAKVRSGMRVNDIAESKLLLWELVTHEPTVLQCFSIVEATCMAQGLFCKIDGERCGEKFQRFIDKYYIPFCRQVIIFFVSRVICVRNAMQKRCFVSRFLLEILCSSLRYSVFFTYALVP